VAALNLAPFEEGLIVGLLVGEGHFGGDGRKPHVTLRMHVRHEALLRWLQQRVPRAKLYGPYHHDGRHYFQWMVRGPALIEDLLPILRRHITPELDAHAHARLTAMVDHYADVIERGAARSRRATATPDTAADADPRSAELGGDGLPAVGSGPTEAPDD
jgi:hypothetical protein